MFRINKICQDGSPLPLTTDGHLRVVFIGVGSAFSKRNRQSNMLLIQGEHHVLVDCGTQGPLALNDIGLNVLKVRCYLPTHSHAEHIGGMEEVGGEEVARMAKVLYARKDALEKILKVRLQEVDRLEVGGMVYTIGKTTQISYPTESTLTVFRELTGKDEDELVPLLLSVEKGKVDALVKNLAKSLAPADARLLKARIEAIAEKSVSPRFNAQRATTAPTGDAP